MLTFLHRKSQILWILLLCLSLIGFPLISHALTVKEVPNPQQQYGGWVTDMANILSEQTEVQLNQMISELEATTGAEIAVVTVPTTSPAPTPKAFTTELFNEWGIGKSGVDNGVLFLTSVGDRRVEIETGYGVEGILPDARVGNIVNTQITPRFREGDWDGGIVAGTQALVSVLSENPEPMGLSDPSLPALSFGATSILALGLSFFGYNKAKYFSRQPIALKPTGRSQVMGRFSLYDFRLYCWSALAVFSVSIALSFLSLLLSPSGLLWQWVSLAFVGLTFLLILVEVWKLVYNVIFSQIEESTASFPGAKIFTVIMSLAVIIITCIGLSILYGGFGIILVGLVFLTEHGDKTLGLYGFTSLIISGFFSLVCAQVILSNFRPKTTFACERCTKTLTGVSEDILSDRFTQPQQVAQQLGSTRFEGWHCSQCYGKHPKKFHLRRYILNKHQFSECPICQEFTVIVTQDTIITHATYSHSGLRQITYQCQSCNYRKDEQHKIPQKIHSTSSSGGGSSSSGGGGSSSGGGGSFGGGSSGGGGAGGSF